MENPSFFGSIVSFFTLGGFWMTPIFFAQVASLAIIAERFVRLYVQRKPNMKSMVHIFEPEIKKGNLDRVISQARTLGHSSMRHIVEAGCQAAMNMGGRDEVQAKIDEVLVREQSKL